METKKICPLLTINGITAFCEKNKCAWWCEFDNCCAMVSIPAQLVDRLSELRDK